MKAAKKIFIASGALAVVVSSLAMLRSPGAPARTEAPAQFFGAGSAEAVERTIQPRSAEETKQPQADQAARAPLAPTAQGRRRELRERRRLAEAAEPFHWDRPPERDAELEEDRRELGDRWSRESLDGSWTSRTVGRVMAILAEKELAPDAVTDVDCRQTICRFALRTPSGRHGDVMSLIRAARAVDPETWTMPDVQSDGTYRVDVFFTREGYRLSSGRRIAEHVRVD